MKTPNCFLYVTVYVASMILTCARILQKKICVNFRFFTANKDEKEFNMIAAAIDS